MVMGVSGSGKSTVATLLAERLGWEFAEGDDFHPRANVDKMHAGHPLTDADRAPWLARIREWIDAHIAAGRSGVVTCSALKRAYRDVLRAPEVRFVHLSGSETLLTQRLDGRTGHFMPPTLLRSQLETLEPLQPDEAGLVVDIAPPPAEQVAEIVQRLGLAGQNSIT